MVDPVTPYNRVPPPFDPESRDSHLDGELGRLEQTTASIISRLSSAATDLETAVTALEAEDADIRSDYIAADAAEVTARDTAIGDAVGAVTARTITAGVGLSGGGDLTASRTVDLEDTAVAPGSYTLASITVDQQGRLTAASSGATPGQTLLATLTTTSGTNATLTGISTTAYTSLICVVIGVSHNGSGGTPQNLRVQVTEDGSTWIGTTSLSSLATADAGLGVFQIFNFKTTVNKVGLWTPNGLSPTLMNATSTAALSGIRFNFSAGAAFDAGTILIYGVP